MELCKPFDDTKLKDALDADDLPFHPTRFIGAVTDYIRWKLGYTKKWEDTELLDAELLEEYAWDVALDPGHDRFNSFMDSIERMIEEQHPDNATINDAKHVSNWGFATRGGRDYPVLIDYGLSDEIWKKHYRWR